MGMMWRAMDLLFGGRNMIADTAEVWRENAEASGQRATQMHSAALNQLAAEYARPQRGWFDGVVDGLNRLPRPMLALGVLGLFGMAMHDPVWFAARMQGLSLVPEPLWWLMGVIVSFYFGARHQAKTQDFQRDMLASAARVPQVVSQIRALEEPAPTDNPALSEWRTIAGGKAATK
ncbi:carboxylesterase [Donghicola sp. C2-DW-16]|uniref:Carboxylesterase n=1 Tax=Donghicola mangrovi TaxID=2729614 RepID=A0ABX2PD07_9RHOB|nr:holin family protein [Donghicola mangrovi]NVO26924.1 carboxylesterase [Donghicola mangrovi]